MKRIFAILLLTVMIYSSNTQPTYAFLGFGDIVFDPTMSLWQIKDSIVQGFQYATELATEANSTLTTYNTTLVQINDTVLKPMRDALTIASIISSGNNVQNLILGGLGNQSLFIVNPGQYVKNKGNASISLNLSKVASQNGAYSDSILNSVINKTRNSDVTKVLSSLSQSSVPSLVQNNLCTDSALNQTAKNDVTKADGTYDPTEFAARKKALYDTLCVGNPKTDPRLAQTLTAVNQQNPSIGGWDTWLATTGGDNPYTSSVLATNAIQKEADDKMALANQDMVVGGGLKSETKCEQSSSVDINGDPVNSTTSPSNIIPCLKESITKTSASLKSMWNDTIGSPLKTLQNSLTGATSIVGTAFNTVGLLKGIDNAFNTTASNLNGSASNGGVSAPVTYSQTKNSAPVTYSTSGNTQPNTPVTTTSTYTQDLAQNPTIKNSIVAPIQKLLNNDLNALSTLSTIDQNYLAEINLYEAQLKSVNDCYDALVRDFSIPKDAGAMSFYTSKKSVTDALLNKITTESNNIPVTTKLITNTLAAITASNSTDQISALFSNYQNQVDVQGLPNATTQATRSGEYQNYKASVEQDLSTNPYNLGSVTTLLNQCSTIRVQQEMLANQNNGGGN